MMWVVILCRDENIQHSCLEGIKTKQIFLQMSSLKKTILIALLTIFASQVHSVPEHPQLFPALQTPDSFCERLQAKQHP